MTPNHPGTILLEEPELIQLEPLTRFRTAFSLRNGIYTELERIRLLFPGAIVYYKNSDPIRESLLARKEGMVPFRDLVSDRPPVSIELPHTRDPGRLDPFQMLDKIGETILEDLEIGPKRFHPLEKIPDGVFLKGSVQEILVGGDVTILPGTFFDTSGGPVILDEGCQVSPFSTIEGPFYAGRNSRLDHVRITGGTILGEQARVGGEIENSIFNDFTNKHHEGFVGHTVAGSWVNFGAISTTSDLKNNYGEVKLEIPASLNGVRKPTIIRTGRIKFGSIIGDHVKIGIGTMISTGSVLDAGSNIFGGDPKKYVPPLSWGNEDGEYLSERFLEDMKKIMGRRDRKPHAADQDLVLLLRNKR